MGYPMNPEKLWARFIVNFWSRVDRSAGVEACWLWLGTINKDGYGFSHHAREKRPVGVHRIAYELEFGIPSAQVLHSCDNPPCCNPSHLFSGTQLDNIRDMIAKGRNRPPRGVYGEKHGIAKLTDNEVAMIRAAYMRGGIAQKEIAVQYGMSKAQISRILSGQARMRPAS